MNETPGKVRTWLWLGLMAVPIFLLGLGARRDEDEGARQVGQALGGLVVPFLFAALVWTIIWALAGRRKGRQWLSPWIGALAIAVAVMAAIGRGAEAAAAPSTLARGVSNSVVFADGRGDAVAINPETADRPDITRVVVSNDVDGLVTLRIGLLERPVLQEDMRLRILIDADRDRTTGIPGGYDYQLVWEARCGGLCGPFPSMSLHFDPNVAVWTFSAEALDTHRFRFAVAVETGIVYDPITGKLDLTNASWDVAPDQTGECARSAAPLQPTCPLWDYGVRYGPARLVAKQLTFSPARPVAGRRLTVGLSAARTDTGEPVVTGTVVCKASLGTVALRAPVQRFVQGRQTCAFVVPTSARGRRLAGSITVVAGGLSLTRTFAREVS